MNISRLAQKIRQGEVVKIAADDALSASIVPLCCSVSDRCRHGAAAKYWTQKSSGKHLGSAQT